MCGIAGLSGKKIDGDLARAMVRALTHRGPDEEGYYIKDDFAFGMRRLSIVDLVSGQQPVYNEDKTVVTVFNGEIYNFAALRDELRARGHRFYTKTDTEVIVHLYEDYGDDLVKHLDGMFALAVWDVKIKRLLLARDRFGKKPLYYYNKNGLFLFGSEIKSLLRHPQVEKKINYEALHHYLSLKHVPGPLTIYQDIFSLPAASTMSYKNGNVLIKRYWTLAYDKPAADLGAGKSEMDIVKTLSEALKEAVQKRMIGDVPVGAYLSGGLDSSLVTAIYSRLTSDRIKTFCLVYDDEIENKSADRRFASLVAKKYHTEHFEYLISEREFFVDLEKVIASFDEPFGGVVSTYFISKLIAQHVKVAISGDGADELFGSYLAHRLALPIDNYLNGRRSPKDLKPFDGEPERLSFLAEAEQWRWRSKLLVFGEEEKFELYDRGHADEFSSYNTPLLYKKYFSESTTTDPLNRVLDVDCRSLLADEVLPFVDRLSMAHSLEVRCPYLDYTFAEKVASLHGKLKIHNGETKYILKKMAEKYLPKELIYRKKEGFIPPINKWLTRNVDFARQILSAASLSRHGFFNKGYVEKLIDKISEQDSVAVNKVWLLLNFQIWYDNSLLEVSKL